MKSGDYISDKTVLKRTHSESGNHIIFLQDMLGKRTWEYMDAHSEIPRCRWFSQTYVPLLKDYGEWRVVIVRGAPAYTVHTQPVGNPRGNAAGRKGKVKVMLMMMVLLLMNMYRETI